VISEKQTVSEGFIGHLINTETNDSDNGDGVETQQMFASISNFNASFFVSTDELLSFDAVQNPEVY